MGLTFGALGILLTAMVALTHWTRGQGVRPLAKGTPSGAIPADTAELEQAAAAAVVVALAQAARRAHPTHAWHAARPGEDLSPWQAHARGQQLEQRKIHQTLRW